jgi:hypothetical protein
MIVRSPMPEPMIKGGMLREFVQWYEHHHGNAQIREVARRVPEDLRTLIDPDEPFVNILAASWYPARLTHTILDVITEGLDARAVERLAHDANRWIVQRGMGSVYRFALRRLVTPEMYAASVARLWRQIHSTGDREFKVTSRTSADSFVRNWGGHHPVLCTVTIETMCALFESMGKQDVRWTRTSCMARGARECATRLEWR